MKIYVASHSQSRAKQVADELVAAGHEVNATWLKEPFLRTADHTEEERHGIALRDSNEIRDADALVLLSQNNMRCPGGKFVEAGIAIGLGKKVVVIGRRENMLMWLPSIVAVKTVKEALEVLR